MVIRQATPFDFEPKARRLSPTTTVVIGASIALHAAVAAYLAAMQFAPPKAPPQPPEIIIDGPMVKLPKPTPPKEPEPLKPRIPARPPIETSAAEVPIAPIPIEPVRVDPQPLGQIAKLTPPAPPPRDPVIRNPTWLKMPSGEEMARFYPDRALRLEKAGKAQLSCTVTATGSVADCRVLSETPADLGFGAAAQKLSRYFRMSPQTVDGQPVEGGQVIIPITFRLG